MKFLDYINDIDNIIDKKHKEEQEKVLFDPSAVSGSIGLGFSTMYNVQQCGPMVRVNYTNANSTGGFTITHMGGNAYTFNDDF